MSGTTGYLYNLVYMERKCHKIFTGEANRQALGQYDEIISVLKDEILQVTDYIVHKCSVTDSINVESQKTTSNVTT
jgi:hypothetical protein